MIQRLAILIGGLGATAIFALALGAAGLFPTVPAPAVQAVDASNINAQADLPAPPTAAAQTQQVKTVTDKVYVEPKPSAPVVHVNRAPRTSAPSSTRQPRTSSPTRQPRGGYEGGDDGGSDNGGSHQGGGGDD